MPLLDTVLLILSWKTAGHLGADRFLLRWLGAPRKDDPAHTHGGAQLASR